jgi:hypothetical protein
VLPKKDVAQRLVQRNKDIERRIQEPNAPGGNQHQWTLKSMQKSRTPNDDLYPYTHRYYLTFDDGSGYLVKISGNYDPRSRRWHEPTFHFASNQPHPTKWGDNGRMRTALDSGTDENPTIQDLNEWLDLFGE